MGIFTDGVHIVTDGNIQELHDFADSVGLKREWFQPAEGHPYYDITSSRMKRKVLRTTGVNKVTDREIVLMTSSLRMNPIPERCPVCDAKRQWLSEPFFSRWSYLHADECKYKPTPEQEAQWRSKRMESLTQKFAELKMEEMKRNE